MSSITLVELKEVFDVEFDVHRRLSVEGFEFARMFNDKQMELVRSELYEYRNGSGSQVGWERNNWITEAWRELKEKPIIVDSDEKGIVSLEDIIKHFPDEKPCVWNCHTGKIDELPKRKPCILHIDSVERSIDNGKTWDYAKWKRKNDAGRHRNLCLKHPTDKKPWYVDFGDCIQVEPTNKAKVRFCVIRSPRDVCWDMSEAGNHIDPEISKASALRVLGLVFQGFIGGKQ